ncbi:hypothetical protein OPT61_g1970 [Boeremia exigua]|uniref:Uncharacterized protein n=1 Tax=Boeremia exigua TaxID=749465 RepID=A0ACC2INF2_9PLEO|nr:hypothetical protein OPT61_g1970 [Boeremia exigua]
MATKIADVFQIQVHCNSPERSTASVVSDATEAADLVTLCPSCAMELCQVTITVTHTVRPKMRLLLSKNDGITDEARKIGSRNNNIVKPGAEAAQLEEVQAPDQSQKMCTFTASATTLALVVRLHPASLITPTGSIFVNSRSLGCNDRRAGMGSGKDRRVVPSGWGEKLRDSPQGVDACRQTMQATSMDAATASTFSPGYAVAQGEDRGSMS